MEKIAVVLLDTFKAKLSVVWVDHNLFNIIDGDSETISLNLEPDADMFLTKTQIEKAIRALKSFRKTCELHKVSKVIAMATFVGENKPKNVHSFLEEVFNTCGFRFSILTNQEENTLIYSGIINTLDMPKGLICHIANESVHLIHYNRRVILDHATLPFGPLTLAEKFPLDAETKTENLEKMQEFVANAFSEVEFINDLDDEDFEAIGSGDFFVDMSILTKRLKKYPLEIVNCYNLKLEDNLKVFDQIKQVEIDSSRKIKGTNQARADLFVASMIITNCFLKTVKHDGLIVTVRNFVEGAIFNQVIETSQDKPITDTLGYSMNAQMSYYSEDAIPHSEQVYDLALILFKQLRVVHKLARGYIKILRLASFMHNCGERISFLNNAKNGFAVLMGSEIYGVTQREQLLAALAISMRSGGDLSVSDIVRYRDIISDEDVDAVRKIATIVRIAEAFDRLKSAVIIDVNCDILGDSVILKTIAIGDSSFEITKAQECEKDFEKFFGKKIEIL